MSRSFHDLQTFQECPRLYVLSCLLGWIAPAKPEALTTGQLVHEALAAYFRQQDPEEAMNKAANECYHLLDYIQDPASKHEASQSLTQARIRADRLSKRYIKGWAQDYKPEIVEGYLIHQDVSIRPDLVAIYHGYLAIVDYKTSHSPDPRWYDISGQVDLYAYVLEEMGRPGLPKDPWLVIYDCISDEGIFRHSRPPRLDYGKLLCGQIGILANFSSISPIVDDAMLSMGAQPQFTCPSRCDFFVPCWLLFTGGDWQDYLEKNFIKESKHEAIRA